MHIEPINDIPYEHFPASPLQPDGMKTLNADFSYQHSFVNLNVEYAVKDGYPLHLQIMIPSPAWEKKEKLPLIMYVQGSAWFPQPLGVSIDPLITFSKRGFVIASVEYRPSTVATFPAQIIDAKTALRFMLKNASEYSIDTDKVVVWGDSSGGHTSSMFNVTLNDKAYTDEPDAPPLDVKAFINFYGVSDISRMSEQPSIQDHLSAESPEGILMGGVRIDENPELFTPASPMNHIKGKQRPMLIIHGDKDRVVPFHQSVLLYEALKAVDSEVEFYKMAGADHGGPPFWSDEVFGIVENFIRKWIN